MLVELEDSEEGLLRDFYCTDLLHTLLPLLLLLEELTLTGYVAPVTLSR